MGKMGGSLSIGNPQGISFIKNVNISECTSLQSGGGLYILNIL
jgi:hypothetical protein